MAGRFITIKYTEGDIRSANKYFSSVFYANIILSIIIGIMLLFAVKYMEVILNIPDELVFDAKLLLALLSVNAILPLLTNVYSLATFIKNRLDLASIRSIISNVIRAILLLVLFAFLQPHIWYIGLVGVLCSLYIVFTNYGFTKKLTPDLVISKINFEWTKVKDLITSGIWNTISQLGTILGQGLDLLIANLFIGATAMGVFSISRQIPFLVISFCSTVASVYAPILMQYYAKHQVEELKNEINKAIRLLGTLVSIPLVFILIFGGNFYKLWVPNQDAVFMHLLTILCGLELIFSLPLEVCWHVFMITNKLRFSTVFMLCNHLLTLFIVLVGVYLVESVELQLIILASTRTILGVIRSLTFLPLYSAWCLSLPRFSFYKPLIKTFVAFIGTAILCYLVFIVHEPTTWFQLLFSGLICTTISIFFSILFVLNSTDRQFIKSRIIKNEI